MVYNPLSFIFDPTGKSAPTYEQIQQRRKIAAAMMARQTRMPKNIGEGLTALGEAYGDRAYSEWADEQERDRTAREAEVRPPVEPNVPVLEESEAPATRVPVIPSAQPRQPIVPPPPPPPGPQAVAPPPGPFTQAARDNILGPQAQGNPQSFVQNREIDTRTFPGNGAARADINPAAVQLGQTFDTRPQSFAPGMNSGRWLMDQANAIDQMGGVPRPPVPPGPGGALQPDAQDTQLSEVMGGPRPQASPYQPTAAVQPGQTMSDAPPNEALRNSVAATLNNQPQPPPPGPQLAQASPFPQPNAGGLATMPGGFQPQGAPITPPPPPPAIQTAPPAPGTQLGKAPEVTPYPRPSPPKLLPSNDDYTQAQEKIASDPYISPARQALAAQALKDYRAKIEKANDQRIQVYNDDMKTYKTQQLPGTIYANEAARLGLEGEGGTPMNAEQRRAYGAHEGQSAWFNRRGEPKFGPIGTSVKVNSDNKAETKGDEETQKELAKTFVDAFKEGPAAAATLRSVTEGRSLASRIDASPFTMAKQSLGRIGVKTEGLSEIQAFDAWVSRTIPTMRAPGSGPASDFDGENFKNSIPTLMTTKEGKSLMFQTMEDAARNNLERSRIGGMVVAGKITRAEGVDKMLELQEQAIALSDKVKSFLDATGKSPKADVVPSDDTMRNWLKDNPSHPEAAKVRKLLEGGK